MIKYTAPNFIDFNITSRCNMLCTHCYLGIYNPEDVEYEVAKNYLKQMSDMGVFKVALTGGEPLLHPNFIDLIGKINDLGMSPMVNTNAFLISKQMLVELHRVLEGKPLWFSISLDGLPYSGYGKLRKWKTGESADNAFPKVINNSHETLRLGNKLVFNFTYTNLNRKDVLPLYEYLKMEFGEENFILNVILFGLSGNGLLNRNTMSVCFEDWKSFLIDLIKRKMEGKLKHMEVEPTCPWEIYYPLKDFKPDIVEKYLGYISPLRNPIYKKYRNVGCHAGITNLAINWDGSVFPCGLYPNSEELCLGNLNKLSLKEIWDKSTILNTLRNIKLENLSEACIQCDLSHICGGGCRGAAVGLTGNIYGEDIRCPLISGRK